MILFTPQLLELGGKPALTKINLGTVISTDAYMKVDFVQIKMGKKGHCTLMLNNHIAKIQICALNVRTPK